MTQETQVKFLEKSLEAIHQQRTSYNNKANFLLGAAGAEKVEEFLNTGK